MLVCNETLLKLYKVGVGGVSQGEIFWLYNEFSMGPPFLSYIEY